MPPSRTDAGPMPSTTQAILRWVRESPNSIAVSQAANQFTYADLGARIAKFKRALATVGLRAGMLVGIECPDRYLHLVLILACESLGAATTSFVPMELESGNELAAACNLICAHTSASLLQGRSDVFWLTDETVNKVLLTGTGNLAGLDVGYNPNAIGRLIRTSGTTNAAKIIPLSFAAIEARTRLPFDALQECRFSGQLILVHDLRLSLALMLIRAALTLGRTIRFSSFETLAGDAASPDGSFILLNSGAAEFIMAAHDSGTWINRTHHILFMGAPVPHAVLQKIKASAAPFAFSVYGATELGMVSRSSDGLTGTLYSGVEIRIHDDNDAVLPPGYVGNVVVRSPQAISRYLGNAELTERHFRDGWFITGDLGLVDGLGHLVIIGRSDDILNIGGQKLHPGAVEAEIKARLGATEVILTTLPDAEGFERICVAIEGERAAFDPKTLPQTISSILEQHFSGPGVSYGVNFVGTFPRTETGKVKRQDLRRSLRARVSRVPATGASRL